MNLRTTFPNLDEIHLQFLLENAQLKTFQTGEIALIEGSEVSELFIIKSGNLRVTRTYLDELAAEFAGPLGPGEVIGEMAFIDGKGASATLIADGPTELLVIPGDVLRRRIEADIAFKAGFFEGLFIDLARKLRSTNQRVLPVAP